ncbi:MAG: hypothetical protein FJZ38_21980, partial [Candidatus Rokubacteria bacterium]|nr:hypothetical protein [Candidatus Rokubacteria bacterium]
MAVSVNGVEAARRDEPAAPVEVALEIPVTLRPGRNVVIVSATDTGGQTQQEARTVFFDPATRRAAVESQRATMQAARAEAQAAEAPRLGPEAWAKASAAEAEAERALAASDFPRADDGFRPAGRRACGRRAARARPDGRGPCPRAR